MQSKSVKRSMYDSLNAKYKVVIKSMIEKKKNYQIAWKLDVTPETVGNYKRQLRQMFKLEKNSQIADFFKEIFENNEPDC